MLLPLKECLTSEEIAPDAPNGVRKFTAAVVSATRLRMGRHQNINPLASNTSPLRRLPLGSPVSSYLFQFNNSMGLSRYEAECDSLIHALSDQLITKRVVDNVWSALNNTLKIDQEYTLMALWRSLLVKDLIAPHAGGQLEISGVHPSVTMTARKLLKEVYETEDVAEAASLETHKLSTQVEWVRLQMGGIKELSSAARNYTSKSYLFD